jgi:hypothetical protein
MRGFGCSINRLARSASERDTTMSPLEKLKSKSRAAREPDSLDIVEQVIEEEGRQAENDLELGSPDWLRLANIVLVLMLVLFLFIARHAR